VTVRATARSVPDRVRQPSTAVAHTAQPGGLLLCHAWRRRDPLLLVRREDGAIGVPANMRRNGVTELMKAAGVGARAP
jgi:hypothetical protein